MSIVTLEYVRLMARYNQWQNTGLRKMLAGLSSEDLSKDQGAFFGSIHGTANHLLWGDMLWMSRFDGGDGPPTAPGQPPRGIKESVGLTDTIAEWETLRFQTDGRIRAWADRVGSVDLTGDLVWYSGAAGREMSKPLGLCVAHFFNHQTHHRGQLHAMLTALGLSPTDTDIPFMPEDI